MDPRKTIGRFVIESEYASGASGTVYTAHDPESGQKVAIKVIRSLRSTDLSRFQREARTLSQLDHPGVVRYIDHDALPDGSAYLVMEWLEGEDLKSRLGRMPLSWQETVQLGMRVAEALTVVHDLRLVHRDIKPANIFLPNGRADRAKLIDFGLIRSTAGNLDVSLTKTGVVLGTPSYMAPEQARGSRKVDGRADLFSLGSVLYRCLAGRAPFEGKHVLAILTKVLVDPPEPIDELRPDIPEELADAVMRMLEKEPANRFQSATLALDALSLLPVPSERPRSRRFGSGRRESVRPPSMMTLSEQRFGAILMVDGAELGGAPGASERCQAIITAHDGAIDVLLDGTLIASFVGDRVIRDHAIFAATCALALQSAVADVKMSLSSGRSEVGKPRGSAIDRAALLLAPPQPTSPSGTALDAPSRIVMDSETAALLSARFEVVWRDELLYLLRARAVETPVRTLLGQATPLVGREWELGGIEQAVRRSIDEQSVQAVLLIGDAGMGKSRIAYEARGLLEAKLPHADIWWGQGDSFRSGSAYFALGQLLSRAADTASAAGPSAPWERLRQFVYNRVPSHDAPWVAEILGDFVGTPCPAGPSDALRSARAEPKLMSLRLDAAWRTLVGAASTERPLVLMLNDLHWMDSATLRLIHLALDPTLNRPVCAIGFTRPELLTASPSLWEHVAAQHLRIRPLSRKASEKLVRAVLPESLGQDTVERLIAQADGNAFYLEELARSVAEARARGVTEDPLPETVLGMAQARLAALDADTRRLLRAASIFGEVFWLGGALLVAGRPKETSEAASLLQAELCTEAPHSRFAGERELCFRHTLVCEAAYATLTPSDRIRGHALAAEWLKRHGETDPLVLARHLEMAGKMDRAAEYLLEAAAHTVALSDVSEGIRLAERALPHLGEGGRKKECLALLSEAYVWHQAWDKALSVTEELIASSSPGTAPWFRGVGARLGAAFSTGRSDLVAGVLSAVLPAEVEPGAESIAVWVCSVIVLVLAMGGQLEAARTMADRVRRLVETSPHIEPTAAAWATLSGAFRKAWIEGDPWSAHRAARLAVALLEAAQHQRYLRLAKTVLGLTAWELGHYEEAETHLRAVAPDESDAIAALLARLYLAFVLIDRGAFAEAREIAQERLSTANDPNPIAAGRRTGEALWIHGEIDALYSEGRDLDRAAEQLRTSLQGLAVTPLQRQLAAARLSDVLRSLGRHEEALTVAREAHQITQSQSASGQRPYWILLVLSRALSANGEQEDAQKTLREAQDLARARVSAIDDAVARDRFVARLTRMGVLEGLVAPG